MIPLDFKDFFTALHGVDPFPWQAHLARQAVESGWPTGLNLPTASGKTACVDVAVFALAKQLEEGGIATRTAPLRTIFVVNRRVIVDEACERARLIAGKLAQAEKDPAAPVILRRVAAALRLVAGASAPSPLGVHLLRGGVYRSESWMNHPTQPQILCCTVDMAGSRLLFRGYGLSDNAKPLAAGLLGQDSLWLLDEAHLSRPFAETLAAVRRYAGSAKSEYKSRPLVVAEMTATPQGAQVFSLEEADRAHPVLKKRQEASKPAKLVPVDGAKGTGWQERLAKEMAKEAFSLRQAETPPRSVAIICNRVATARKVAEELKAQVGRKKSGEEVELVIGRMRPIDRDKLTLRLQRDLALKSGSNGGPACFVVATQCLEAGADFDFDAMVSELASLDALRQRFGRLNRLGRAIQAQAVIVASGEMLGDKPDAIYGESANRTWEWLKTVATDKVVDFGLSALAQHLDRLPEGLVPSPLHASVMLPAHVDLWSQTSPRPAADPDVDPFLHGAREANPEVSVVWRADLKEQEAETWPDRVTALPPVSCEAMSVPIHEIRRFLNDADKWQQAVGGDADGVVDGGKEKAGTRRQAVIWQGDEAQVITGGDEVRPSSVVILPAFVGGWSVLGHVPGAPADPAVGGNPTEEEWMSVDCAEEASLQATARVMLRADGRPWSGALVCLKKDEEPSALEIREAVSKACGFMPEKLAHGAACVKNWRVEVSEGKDPVLYVVGRERVGDSEESELPVENLDCGRKVSLAEHNREVGEEAGDSAKRLGLSESACNTLRRSGGWHDLGKLDPRFQAWLRGGNVWAVGGEPLAKSGGLRQHPLAIRAQREKAGVPDGFRHELLSVSLLEKAGELDDLMLHLVASHHGRCRGFAPAVREDSPVDVTWENGGRTITVSSQTQLENVGSGITRRFWACQRLYGWWGLAQLEAILRLADHAVSRREQENKEEIQGGTHAS